jgi:tRNA A37 threonylcarbamoyladenosine modification protein TsaB
MSVTLAMEWSTRRLSVATGGVALSPLESVLEVDRFHGPAAIGLLETHLAERDIPLSSVDELVIGRGPGNFSGIRLAFAWAAGCMAPGGVTLRAHSSGRVMAERLMKDAPPFYVLGDARRGFWWGCAVREGHIGDWTLETPEVWRDKIGGSSVYSSEAARLGALSGLQEAYPSALDLLTTRQAPEERAPLYLHPAV